MRELLLTCCRTGRHLRGHVEYSTTDHRQVHPKAVLISSLLRPASILRSLGTHCTSYTYTIRREVQTLLRLLLARKPQAYQPVVFVEIWTKCMYWESKACLQEPGAECHDIHDNPSHAANATRQCQACHQDRVWILQSQCITHAACFSSC